MDAAFFAGFNQDLHNPGRWDAFYRSQQAKDPGLPRIVPPIPELDGEWLFWDMMTRSSSVDPWMYPALQNLKASGKFIVAALSNTVIFPDGHELSKKHGPNSPLRSLFDVFVSSAHVGLRKPDPSIYQLAHEMVNKFALANANSERGRELGWQEGVAPSEILFLDDIGENLRAAKSEGFQTIKVPLGKSFEAVEALEKVTGLKLEGNHPKIPIKPRMTLEKARI